MTHSRRVLLVVLTWALSACSTLVRVPEAPVAGRGGPPIEAYARVLERFVNDRGEVDFSALALIGFVARFSPEPIPLGYERPAQAKRVRSGGPRIGCPRPGAPPAG